MGIRHRLVAVVVIVASSLFVAGCNVTVGVGVGVAYPGPYYGPWGGGVYVGGPVYIP